MTLEEAQEKLLELQEENQQLKADKETLSQDNENLKNDNENLRTLNQKYFNKLIAQEEATENNDGDEEGDDVLSCEEFAKTIEL